MEAPDFKAVFIYSGASLERLGRPPPGWVEM
jgi:hypothetical protein